MTLELDVTQRTRIVTAVVDALQQALTGSTCCLRGSLAAGSADDYSDIDLQWTVAVADFGDACRATHLTRVGEVEALRTDPLIGVHPTQRLIFFRVAGLPLFWRVDLEILSAEHDPEAVHPPGSFQSSETWSATHSALMCAVAAIKAFLRHRPDEGAHLVSKGFERIHIPVPTVPPRRQILALIDTIYGADDTHAPLVAQIRQLCQDAFAETGGSGGDSSKR